MKCPVCHMEVPDEEMKEHAKMHKEAGEHEYDQHDHDHEHSHNE